MKCSLRIIHIESNDALANFEIWLKSGTYSDILNVAKAKTKISKGVFDEIDKNKPNWDKIFAGDKKLLPNRVKALNNLGAQFVKDASNDGVIDEEFLNIISGSSDSFVDALKSKKWEKVKLLISDNKNEAKTNLEKLAKENSKKVSTILGWEGNVINDVKDSLFDLLTLDDPKLDVVGKLGEKKVESKRLQYVTKNIKCFKDWSKERIESLKKYEDNGAFHNKNLEKFISTKPKSGAVKDISVNNIANMHDKEDLLQLACEYPDKFANDLAKVSDADDVAKVLNKLSSPKKENILTKITTGNKLPDLSKYTSHLDGLNKLSDNPADTKKFDLIIGDDIKTNFDKLSSADVVSALATLNKDKIEILLESKILKSLTADQVKSFKDFATDNVKVDGADICRFKHFVNNCDTKKSCPNKDEIDFYGDSTKVSAAKYPNMVKHKDYLNTTLNPTTFDIIIGLDDAKFNDFCAAIGEKPSNPVTDELKKLDHSRAQKLGENNNMAVLGNGEIEKRITAINNIEDINSFFNCGAPLEVMDSLMDLAKSTKPLDFPAIVKKALSKNKMDTLKGASTPAIREDLYKNCEFMANITDENFATLATLANEDKIKAIVEVKGILKDKDASNIINKVLKDPCLGIIKNLDLTKKDNNKKFEIIFEDLNSIKAFTSIQGDRGDTDKLTTKIIDNFDKIDFEKFIKEIGSDYNRISLLLKDNSDILEKAIDAYVNTKKEGILEVVSLILKHENKFILDNKEAIANIIELCDTDHIIQFMRLEQKKEKGVVATTSPFLDDPDVATTFKDKSKVSVLNKLKLKDDNDKKCFDEKFIQGMLKKFKDVNPTSLDVLLDPANQLITNKNKAIVTAAGNLLFKLLNNGKEYFGGNGSITVDHLTKLNDTDALKKALNKYVVDINGLTDKKDVEGVKDDFIEWLNGDKYPEMFIDSKFAACKPYVDALKACVTKTDKEMNVTFTLDKLKRIEEIYKSNKANNLSGWKTGNNIKHLLKIGDKNLDLILASKYDKVVGKLDLYNNADDKIYSDVIAKLSNTAELTKALDLALLNKKDNYGFHNWVWDGIDNSKKKQ